MHRIMVSQVIPAANQVILIDGEEAEHAVRVKRVAGGESVELLDGAGVVADGLVERVDRSDGRHRETVVEIRVRSRRESPFPGVRPHVEVCSATPKGGRVEEMIDGLSQVGAAAWSPLETARGVVDPREGKLTRLERIAREAAKQCGRCWVLRIGASLTLERAIADSPDSAPPMIVVADTSGEPWSARSRGAPTERPIRILIGPEGGWTEEELGAARRAGASLVRFGPHVMRIETAAVAACAVVMADASGGRG